MKRTLVVMLWLSSLSAHAGWFNFGGETKATPAKKNPEVAIQNSNSQKLSMTADAEPAHSTVLRVAPAYNVLFAPPGSDSDVSSISGIGVGIDLLFHTSARTKMGLETGFISYSSDTETATGIPLMYSLLYEFNPGETSMYLGFSGGFVVFQAEETTRKYNYSSGKYETKTEKRMLPLPTVAFRPGVNFHLSPGISAFVEAKMGVLLIAPFIAPQAGIAIGL